MPTTMQRTTPFRYFPAVTALPVRDDLEASALRIAARRRASLPLAPAVFIGIQEGWGAFPDSELFNLTAAIPERTVGSTVTRETLEAAGYYVPKVQTPLAK